VPLRHRPSAVHASDDGFSSGFLLDSLRPQARPPSTAPPSEHAFPSSTSVGVAHDNDQRAAAERRGLADEGVSSSGVRFGGARDARPPLDRTTASPFFAAGSVRDCGSEPEREDGRRAASPKIQMLAHEGHGRELETRAALAPAASAPLTSQPSAPPPSPLREGIASTAGRHPHAPAASTSARSVPSRASSESGVAADDAPLQQARAEYIGLEYGTFMGHSDVDGGSAAAPPPAPPPVMCDQRTQTVQTMGVDATTQTDE